MKEKNLNLNNTGHFSKGYAVGYSAALDDALKLLKESESLDQAFKFLQQVVPDQVNDLFEALDKKRKQCQILLAHNNDRKKKMKKFSIIAPIAAGLILLTGCSIANTAPDQAAVHYSAGPLSSTTFENCIEPGQRNVDGIFNEHYYYPAGQRSFVFDNSDNEAKDSGAFTAPSKDQVLLTLSGQVTFELNTDCDTLKEFHEKIGLKDDWNAILKTYFSQPLNRALTDATQQFNWGDLYSNVDGAAAKWEAKVKELLPNYIKQATGGEYFINVSTTLQKPAVSPELQSAIEATQQAVQQNRAQQERNVQVTSELESIRALVAVLGPDGYNTYQAIKDGKIQVVTIPQGSAINVTPR